EAAQKVYDALTGLKRDPGLLEQTGEGAFAFHVFPIEPGEKKRVQVSTSHWLERRGAAVEFRGRVARADAKIEFDIRDARGVKNITSTSHDLDITKVSTSESRVTIKASKTPAPAVLALDYETDNVSRLTALVHHDPGHDGFFTASLSAPAAPAATRADTDVTLVIDRSGSMQGDSMANARDAATAMIDKLAPGDSVDVIAFDDKVEHLFASPEPMSDDVRRKAKHFISTIDARGGTDIALALKDAFKVQKQDGRTQAILFLTDGQSDGPSAIKAAQDESGTARVFTVGIGTGVDKALLARLAQIRHGHFTYIPDVHAVASEFPRVLAQLQAPALTDVVIHADGAVIDRLYPGSLGDLFPADELRVFGRLTGTGPAKLVVDGKDHGVAKHFETPIDPTSTQSAPFVARSWARARIDEVMGDMREKGETAELKEEVIDLGLAYGIVTQYTSFLAVPEKALTADAASTLGDLRQERAKVLALNTDAAALSRMNMPPGDPVLRVSAPRSAQRVTAMFPFGLTQDLAWDELSEGWSTRFLVPKDVSDGRYEVPVVVVAHDGTVSATSVHYTIDSKSAAIDIVARASSGAAPGAEVRVIVDEAALEARVADADDPQRRINLVCDANGAWTGLLPLASGHHRLRIVVADVARNETEQIVELDIP
ncbi:MAG: VWA domain-containing protein, partial [Polyangiaceae bacterium]